MVRRKELKKALYLLKKYNQTPIEVIEYMSEKLLTVETNKNDNIKNSSDYNYGYLTMTNDMVREIAKNFPCNTCKNNIISKKGFNKFRNIFKDITNNIFEVSYETFEKADSMVINNQPLEAVKEIKTNTKYDLRNSKLIIDCLRLIHEKINISYF